MTFKYNEDRILNDVIQYIGSTYGAHYNTEEGLQTLDVFMALGSAETTARDNAIKYLMRYGKKGGKNVADLRKIIHYVTIMMYLLEKENNQPVKAEKSELLQEKITFTPSKAHLDGPQAYIKSPIVSVRESD